MAGERRRTDLELLDDRHKLAQLALTNPGASSSELAILFEQNYGRSIPARTVRYDLQQLKKTWVTEAKDNMEILRQQELRRMDALEQETWSAWRASMEPVEKVVVERLHRALNEGTRAKIAGELASELADKNEYVTEEVLEAIIRDAIKESLDNDEDSETFVNKITTSTEIRVGDPRYLSQIHEIQKERRKVLGVYAPELHQIQMQKIELKGYAGGWSPDNWKQDDIIDGEVVKEEPQTLNSGELDNE